MNYNIRSSKEHSQNKIIHRKHYMYTYINMQFP
jgi:hypothetical protein